MPVQIQWYCENQVVYARYYGDMTIADVMLAMEATAELMNRSDVPLVHVIVDFNDMRTYPPLGELMKHFKAPPRAGWSMVIGLVHNPIARFFVQVVATSVRMRHRQVQSLDEALDFLQKVDASLPDLQQYRHNGAAL